jgi:hypothetical protein
MRLMESEPQNNRMSKLFVTRLANDRVDVKAGRSLPSTATLEEVLTFFDHYVKAVNASDLSVTSKTMYIDFADNFIRWLYGGFEPGSRGRNPTQRRRTPTRNDG